MKALISLRSTFLPATFVFALPTACGGSAFGPEPMPASHADEHDEEDEQEQSSSTLDCTTGPDLTGQMWASAFLRLKDGAIAVEDTMAYRFHAEGQKSLARSDGLEDVIEGTTEHGGADLFLRSKPTEAIPNVVGRTFEVHQALASCGPSDNQPEELAHCGQVTLRDEAGDLILFLTSPSLLQGGEASWVEEALPEIALSWQPAPDHGSRCASLEVRAADSTVSFQAGEAKQIFINDISYTATVGAAISPPDRRGWGYASVHVVRDGWFGSGE